MSRLVFIVAVCLLGVLVFLIPEALLSDELGGVADDLLSKAQIYRRHGRNKEALECYDALLTHFSNDPGSAALWHTEAGRTLYAMGRYDEALSHHAKALFIQREVLGNNHPDTAESLEDMSRVHQMTGNYGQALTECEQALAIRLKTSGPDHVLTALCHNNLGAVYERMGDAQRALSRYDASLAILSRQKGMGDPLTASALHNKGSALLTLKRYDEARTCHEKALGIRKRNFGKDHPETALSMNALGCLCYQTGEWKKAVRMFNKAVTIREKVLGPDHPLTASGRFNLASALFRSGQCDQAAVQARIAASAHQSQSFAELSWRIFDLLREIHETGGKLESAVIFGKMAVNGVQDMRNKSASMPRSLQTAFIQDKYVAFENLARLLLDLGRIAEAQDVLSMMKQEEYHDFITRDADLSSRSIAFSPEEREWIFHNYQTGPSPLSIPAPPETSPVNTLSADLPERLARFGSHTAMIHYLITENRLMILLTSAMGRIIKDVPVSSADLVLLVDQYLTAITRLSEKTAPLAKSLYTILLAPVREELDRQNIRTIMVAACGPLRYVPMAALTDGPSYMAEHYALVMATSLTRAPTPRHSLKPWTVCGMGASEKVNPSFNALPSVKQELDRIILETRDDPVGIFPGVILLNNRFTRRSFIQSQSNPFSVMHVATHFTCNPGTAEDSFLLLGDGTRLSLLDIQQEPLCFEALELVTLSACRTALAGADKNGREFESLGFLFQSKGAESVIASLWSVSDQSTPLFMEKMYALLKDHPDVSKAELLRQTQVWFFRDFCPDSFENTGSQIHKAPYFWAPFVLMEHL